MQTLQQINIQAFAFLYGRRLLLLATVLPALLGMGSAVAGTAAVFSPVGSNLRNTAMLADTTVKATLCAGGTYVFGNQTLTESGTYVENFVASDGSDSTVTLILTVQPAPVTELNYALCEGATFVFGGDTLTGPGVYTDTLTSPEGCDSVLILSLKFVPFFQTEFKKSICEGDTVFFAGEGLTHSGIYTDSLTASGGCDSVVTLVLTVNNRPVTNIVTGICEGTFYIFGGDTLSAGGIYRDTLKTVNGCDSILVLDLTVAAFFETTLSASICDGQSYTFAGQDLTAAGIYTDSLHAAGGCDSTIVLNLTVLPVWVTHLEATICENDTLEFQGELLVESGEYKAVLTSADGCDSTLVLQLHVVPLEQTALTATICFGQTYNFNGTALTESGVYTAILSSASGCDSTVSLTLFVTDPIPVTEQSASICDKSSYEWNGQVLTVPGVYEVTLQAANGCDSTVVLTLEVLPVPVSVQDASICAGGAFEFGGQLYTDAGTYIDTLTAENDCDSLSILNLSVLPVFASALNATICAHDTYAFNGQSLNITGTYTAIYTAGNGCDSTVTLHLDVLPASASELQATICVNETYAFNGQLLNAPGTYTAIVTAGNGCDSTVTLILEVLPTAETLQSATICSNESYDFYGQLLTVSGTYEQTFQAANGCDSTIVLDLTVLPTANAALSIQICNGTSYNFNGQDLTESGNYMATLSSVNGCDSLVTLELLTADTFFTALEANICSGAAYQFDGQDLTESGEYQAAYTAVGGCDSLVNLILTVLPASASTSEAVICAGASYEFNGQTLTEEGTYTAVLTNAAGCDSTVTLVLTVLPTSASNLEVSICAGVLYEFNGLALTESGTYTSILINGVGCDSTVTLVLTVIPTSSSAFEASICAGASYEFNGEALTESGTYTAALTNAAGCDSTVTVVLTVQPEVTTTVEAGICAGDSYEFNGETLTESGTYTATLINAAGCDSTITLVLAVQPVSATAVEASICSGTSYEFNGQTLTESGTYTALLTNGAGCDSTVTLSLTVLPTSQTNLNEKICAGESYPFAGQLLTEPGVYTVHLTNTSGCDSSIMLTLAVVTVNVTVSLQTNVLTAQAGANATYQWIDCATNQPIAGATESTFTPAVSGSYAVVAMQDGCSATSTCVEVIIISTSESPEAIHWQLFPNPADDHVLIRVDHAAPASLWAEIYDATGRLCARQVVAANGATSRIYLSELPDGLLWVRLVDGSWSSETKRLIIMHR